LRYDFNTRPVEAMDRFTTFVPGSGGLGDLVQTSDYYDQNTKDFGPRVGFAYDIWGDGKTVLRAGYGLLYDQPVLNTVSPMTSNPPFAAPQAFNTPNQTIPVTNIAGSIGGTGVGTLNMIDPNFRYPYVQSWNLNLQKEITPTLGMMIGYFGSKGTHLRDAINLNQITPGNPTRPFTKLSNTSPNRKGATLGNITEIESGGHSNYNALWVTGTKHMSHGLQFQGSYTWSKSMDINSLSSQGVIMQDSFNPQNNYGPSDFDVTHRFTLSGVYDLPFMRQSRLGGWELATIFQVQGGNPFTIITGKNITGLTTSRPNVLGPVHVVDQLTSDGRVLWFTAPTCGATITAGCALQDPGAAFGNMSRNAVRGPGFENLDLSAIKNTKITERLTTEFRVETFNLLNHPNLAQPITAGFIGANMTNSLFGKITATRFPTGDAGSSRQLQFALKFKF
jgi:hypothetical protein